MYTCVVQQQTHLSVSAVVREEEVGEVQQQLMAHCLCALLAFHCLSLRIYLIAVHICHIFHLCPHGEVRA